MDYHRMDTGVWENVDFNLFICLSLGLNSALQTSFVSFSSFYVPQLSCKLTTNLSFVVLLKFSSFLPILFDCTE